MRVERENYNKRFPDGFKEQSPKMRYFIAFEGEKTEYEYLKGVIRYKRELGIDDLIEIRSLLKHYSQKSWSNPSKLCSLVIQDIKRRESGDINVDQLVSHFTDWIISTSRVSSKDDLEHKLLNRLMQNGINQHTQITADNEQQIIALLCDAVSKLRITRLPATKLSDDSIAKFKDSITKFKKYLKEQRQLSIKDGDKVCIVVDRDKESFTEKQYDSVLNKCKDESIDLYVSNPRFEFWLLLHFLKKEDIDDDKLLQKVDSGSRPYLEDILSKHLIGFSKRCVPFDALKDRVDFAIANEKEYCEDVVKLKTEVGCNVGLLLSEMKQR